MWTKIGEEFFRHPKIVTVGRDARDLYLVALCHCNENLTDGFVAERYLRRLAAEAEIEDVEAAVHNLCGSFPMATGSHNPLWHKITGGYLIHDFLEYNPSRRDVEEERARKADAGRRGGQARAARRASKTTGAQGPAQAPALPLGIADAQAPAKHGAKRPAKPDTAAESVSVSESGSVPPPPPKPPALHRSTAVPLAAEAGEAALRKGGGGGEGSFPPGWEGADTWEPETLLAAYRKQFPERQAELSQALASATGPVRSQAAYLRPSILRRLKGVPSPEEIALPEAPAPRSKASAVNARVTARLAEMGVVTSRAQNGNGERS